MNKKELITLKEIILKEQFDDAINNSLKIKNDFEKAYDNAIKYKKKTKKKD